MLTRKQLVISGMFTVLAVGGIAIGANLAGGGTSTTAPPTTSIGAVNPLTGKPGEAGKVLIVKIDNVHAARPATGLSKAAIVYAVQVEGGLSRLAAVFDTSNLPPIIGPVRSARETDLQLLPQYGRPAFAFSGAQSKLLPVLKASNRIETVESGYFRSPDQPAPHNEYLHTRGAADHAGAVKDIGLRFSKSIPDGGRKGTLPSANFPAARFTFQWIKTRDQYSVAMDSASQPWHTENIIVQHVKIHESRFHSRTGFVPFSQTVGSGTATVYRNGRGYACTWFRGSINSGTTYTQLNGDTMTLNPGRTWIVLAD